MSRKSLPSLFERHWAQSALAIGAVVIAAVSLWIAVDTELTNHRMVAAASRPFLQQNFSDATYPGRQLLMVNVSNSGIGPAKVESVEVSWRGKPYRSARELLKDCCGYSPQVAGKKQQTAGNTSLITSTLQGWVLRAGETLHLIWYPHPATDPGPWERFKSVIESPTRALRFRICYLLGVQPVLDHRRPPAQSSAHRRLSRTRGGIRVKIGHRIRRPTSS